MQPVPFENICQSVLLDSIHKKALELSPTAVHALTGLLAGGAVGSMLPSKSTGNRVMNALTGASLGGAFGLNTGGTSPAKLIGGDYPENTHTITTFGLGDPGTAGKFTPLTK